MDRYIHLEPLVKLQTSPMFTCFFFDTKTAEAPCQTDIWKKVGEILALGHK